MPDMKTYLIALGVGLLVGVIYGLLNVRSPAPPIIALVGLLGILLGEQIVPLTRHSMASKPITNATLGEACGNDVLGSLPCSPRDDQS